MDGNSNQRVFFKMDGPTGDIIRRWQLGSSILNTWTHIVITGTDFTDATTINLYVNSSLATPNQTTNTLTAIPTIPDKFAIGGGVTGASLYSGLIDEYSVFNKELNQGEVDELYNLGEPSNLRELSFLTDILTWYRFGDVNQKKPAMENQVNSNEAVVMISYNNSFYVGDVP